MFLYFFSGMNALDKDKILLLGFLYVSFGNERSENKIDITCTFFWGIGLKADDDV